MWSEIFKFFFTIWFYNSEKMASAPDMELKKAFTELQMKMVETKQKIKLTDMQEITFSIIYFNGVYIRSSHLLLFLTYLFILLLFMGFKNIHCIFQLCIYSIERQISYNLSVNSTTIYTYLCPLVIWNIKIIVVFLIIKALDFIIRTEYFSGIIINVYMRIEKKLC